MSNQDETALPAPLEPDTSENSDVDSAYGESVNGMLTTSLGPSVLEYTYENGRRYHAYREGSYMLPNDEKEQDRLDLLHHIFKMLLKGELITAPIPKNPQRVLDFGTGTGIWALDFAHQHPSAVVIGTDLSPIQPEWTAPNCRFMIDDVEAPWTWQENEAFDFIHGRGMAGCIGDWSKLYSEIFKHLKPGGYLEMQEYETWIRNDEDPEYKNAPITLEWQLKADEASTKFGKRLRVAAENKQKMIDAGFEDVTEIIHRLPLGPWPKGHKQKEIGTYQLVQSLEAVEPFTLAFFTRVLGWSHDDAQVLIAGVKNEMRRKKNHFYCLIHFVHGRKPKSA